MGFMAKKLLASHLALKLDNHPFLAVHDNLLNIFAATLQIWSLVSSIHNLRMYDVVVTGTHII
jgi:hypothetical protein